MKTKRTELLLTLTALLLLCADCKSTSPAFPSAPDTARSRPAISIADELSKSLSRSWSVTLSNNAIRIESKQKVWLLYPSLPPVGPGESQDHYARKYGYKTTYQITLTFVPRLTRAQLNRILEERRPFERMVEEGANDKGKVSEAAQGLAKHPLPTFFTDHYSIFMESPYGFAGVHPPEAAERADQAMGVIRKLFDHSHINRFEAQALVNDPVRAIREILPLGWAILKVQTNTYPSYRPEGAGTGIFLGIQGKKYLKQDHSAEVYIMPRDYQDGGEDPTHGKAQAPPPRLVATTQGVKIYLWPGPQSENWLTMEEDLLKALLK